jgi:two-component system chemotaxis sensor kinase CheA
MPPVRFRRPFAMFNRDLDTLNRISDTVGKIALEVALAQPGKDFGLLPVNCLLGELKDAAAKLPPEINAAVGHANDIVDGVFNSTGVFDNASIKQLTDCANWMNGAVLDGLNDRPIKSFAVATPAGTPAANAQAPAVAAVPAAAGEASLVLDLENDGELLVEFCAESQEHLQNIEQGVLVLEQKPDDADTLNTIFRAFHTFKGGAGLLNLLPIKELAHELETVLDLARTHKLTVDKAIIDLILAGGDTFKQFIVEISARTSGKNPGAPICVPTQELLIRVRVVSIGGTRRPSAATAAPVKVVPATPAQVAPVSAPTPAPQQAVAAKKSPAKQASQTASVEKAAGGSVVKVDTLKLDSLIDLVGEMVIAQSQVGQDEQVTAIESQRLTRNLAQLGRITKELQRTAMSLRMVPIRATFQKMTRLVRDVSSKQDKQAELILAGEDTELDRTIVEEISDPLIHMIRNSVDHGIEKPEDRVKAGKSAQGTVRLSAFHQGGNIVIQIQDDGRGLNPEKLKAKALERGVITEKDRLTDKEAYALIFAAGFSTAEVITEISGRGVGMDVVRRNIEKLRGKIDIESAIGQGTTFTISLPLTLAIIDGLIVTIGEQRFILPTLSVRESFRPTQDMLTTVHEKGEMVNVRGKLSPLLRMYEFYDVKPRTTDPTDALLVVVDNNGETRCLMVDQLLGKQEVVIKSLGETFKKAPAIAGGAILGDGRVGLIIDANSLVSLRNLNKAIAA